MPALTLANFGLYVLHVAAVAAIGVGLPAALGVATPRARLFYYRLVLVAALALPLVRPVAPPAPATRGVSVEAPAGGPAATTPNTYVARTRSANAVTLGRLSAAAAPLVGAVVVIGFLARALWVVFGFVALRRLRRGATALEPRPVPIAEAVALAASDADMRLSPDIAHPVNFGARRPAVLFPRDIGTYPADEQRAIACHELVHVRRRDWLQTVGEELVRAIFWFHPAVWWLLNEVHLAREQVVDQEVVELTASRRPYLEALVKLARPAARPALRPAALFLRRAHLQQRVALLIREVHMSRTRLVGSLILSTATVLVAGAVAVWALPLRAAPAEGRANSGVPAAHAAAPARTPAQAQQQAAPRPAPPPKPPRELQPKLLSRPDAVYPPEAKAKDIKGVVIVQAHLNTSGEVNDVKVLRSIPALDQSAIDAVKQYRFEPVKAEMDVVVAVPFPPGVRQPSYSTRMAGGKVGMIPASVPGPKPVSAVKPVYPPEAKAKGIKGVVILQARVDTAGQVAEVKVLRSVPALDQAAIDAVKQWRYQPQPAETKVTIAVAFPPKGE